MVARCLHRFWSSKVQRQLFSRLWVTFFSKTPFSCLEFCSIPYNLSAFCKIANWDAIIIVLSVVVGFIGNSAWFNCLWLFVIRKLSSKLWHRISNGPMKFTWVSSTKFIQIQNNESWTDFGDHPVIGGTATQSQWSLCVKLATWYPCKPSLGYFNGPVFCFGPEKSRQNPLPLHTHNAPQLQKEHTSQRSLTRQARPRHFAGTGILDRFRSPPAPGRTRRSLALQPAKDWRETVSEGAITSQRNSSLKLAQIF